MVPIYCPLCCDQPFKDQQSLFFHLRGIRNNLFCPICSERFGSLEYLVSHLSRTCYGPVSAPEAKRRCLSTSSELADGVSNDIASPSVSPGTQTINNVGNDKRSLLNSPTNNAVRPVGLPVKSTTVVPQELINRIPKNVTLRVNTEVITVDSPQKEVAKSKLVKPLSTLLDKVKLVPSPALTNGPSTNSAVKRLSMNTSVDIKVKATPIKSTVLPVKLVTAKEPSSTPGPACSKVASSSKLIEPAPQEKQNAKSDKRASLVSKQESPVQPKKRGRPRKKRDEPSINRETDSELKSAIKNHEPEINMNSVSESNGVGTPKTHEPEYVLPDIIDESSLFAKTSLKQPGKELENDKTRFVKNSSIPDTSMDDDSNHFEDAMDVGDDCQENQETNSTQTESEQPQAPTEPKEGAHEESKSEEDDEEYTCSACQVRFASIYEHIKEYHNGEDVVVEIPEEEIKEDLKACQQNLNVTVSDETEETDSPLKEDLTETDTPEEKYNKGLSSSDSEIPQNNTAKRVNGAENLVIPKAPIQVFSFQNRFSFLKVMDKARRTPGPKWMCTAINKKRYFQFVTDLDKFKLLVEQLKNNSSMHPTLKAPIKDLFDNPKINVIEITHKKNTPFFTNREIDFTEAIPMYVLERQPVGVEMTAEDGLGGIASYIISNTSLSSRTKLGSESVDEESKIIAVMKVILAKDRLLSIENIVFKDKPASDFMIPMLEDVKDPEIPLLRNSKLLMWMCVKCLATTWKFPLTKDSHSCNGCPICHKPFVALGSLKKHLILHKKSGSDYCEHCHTAFSKSAIRDQHVAVHHSHILCPLCKLFVHKFKEEDHMNLHKKTPAEQFPCSVCFKMFGSNTEVKDHENKLCSRLIAKFNCSLCDKKFFTHTALSLHTQKHKSSTVKYPCRYCPKKFLKEKEQCPRKAGKRKPSSYIQKIWHERIHTRDRPYLCSSCPKRFRSTLHQSSHEKKVHTESVRRDVPIHMCGICDKVFRTVELLTTHLTEHTSPGDPSNTRDDDSPPADPPTTVVDESSPADPPTTQVDDSSPADSSIVLVDDSTTPENEMDV